MPNSNWNDVGDKIKDAVDSAISTGDFTNLSRSIGDVINDTIDNVKSSVKVSVKTSYSSNPYYKTVHTRPAPDQPQMPELYNKRPGGQAGAIISMALGYSIGIFTLAGLITFTALSAAVPICLLFRSLFLVYSQRQDSRWVSMAPKKFAC